MTTLKRLDAQDSLNMAASDIYEPNETKLLEATLKPGMVFVDVGAHIGYYTVMAAELVGPAGRVYAFEPAPLNFEILRENTAQYTDRVTLFNAAVSDVPGRRLLSLNAGNSGDNRLYEMEGREHVEVDVVTLDEALDGVVADWMKIDAQGKEWHVLRGGEALIGRSPRLQIIMEFLPHVVRAGGEDTNDTLKLISRLGFIPHTFRDGRVKRISVTHMRTKRFHKNLILRRKVTA